MDGKTELRGEGNRKKEKKKPTKERLKRDLESQKESH